MVRGAYDALKVNPAKTDVEMWEAAEEAERKKAAEEAERQRAAEETKRIVKQYRKRMMGLSW